MVCVGDVLVGLRSVFLPMLAYRNDVCRVIPMSYRWTVLLQVFAILVCSGKKIHLTQL